MLVGGAVGGWRDWWVAAVVGVSVVGEAAVVGVSVGAGDGVAGCADGWGWEGGPVPWWFVRVSWLSVDSAAFRGVLESWPRVLSAMLWFLVPAFRVVGGSPGFVAGEGGASGVSDCSARAVCAGCVVVASGVGGVGDGGVLGVGAGGGGPMVRVPGTLGGSALLGFLLAIPGGGCCWCQWW